MPQEALTEFPMLRRRREHSGDPNRRGLPALRAEDCLRVVIADVGDLDLLDPPFDAIVAMDCWPSSTLDVTVRGWRRVLDPAGGVVIVVGTDLPLVDSARQPASQQWTAGLRVAGFEVEVASHTPTTPGRYTDFSDQARLAAASLRSELGPEVTNSYLAHIDLLEQRTRHGSTCRFEIIGRLVGEP